MDKGNIVTLRKYSVEMDAELARATLEAHGIRAEIARDDCGGMEPQLSIAGGARLLVLDGDARAASEILGHPEDAQAEER